MRFPYTQVGPGIFRPQIPLFVKGTKGAILIEGLLDPGSDRTVIPLKHAVDLEIVLDSLTSTVTVQSATGQALICKTTTLIFELLRDFEQISWFAEVAIAPDALRRPHWGFKGFLEFFRTVFDGPNLQITLDPGPNLPRTTAPA
jgi:hypothetical protein